MPSVNKVELVGNVGQDPEISYTSSGAPKASFSLATNESWKDRITKEKKEHTDWHRVECWRNVAEAVDEYVSKGCLVWLSGKIRYEKYTDRKSGDKKYFTKIIADRVLFLRGPNEEKNEESGRMPDDETPF